MKRCRTTVRRERRSTGGDDGEFLSAHLLVFSANGLYDLATPFFATEYTLGHLGVNAALQAHIRFAYYPCGHMIYLNPAAHGSLARDLATFYGATDRRT